MIDNAPTVGSLFSGIGGIDLGLERAGFRIAWQCEIDPWSRRVLAKHWPDVQRFEDVHDLDESVPWVDVLAGGFPCQPVSLAGKGLAQDDPRWLWPEFARFIRMVRPRLVFVENVPGLFRRGFGDVLGDLAACGYDAEWDCIPASAVGAPHRRDRVWVVAYADGQSEPGESVDAGPRCRKLVSGPAGNVAYARCGGLRPVCGSGEGRGETCEAQGQAWERERRRDKSCCCRTRVADANRSGLSDVQGGAAISEHTRVGAADRSGWWDVEPDVGRVAHGIPRRVDRLRGLGNAVVPQVVEWIGHRMMEEMR